MRNPVELQLDELCARGKDSPQETWVYNGLEVWSRLWVAGYVGRPNRRSTRLFLSAAKGACRLGPEPFLVTTDPYVYDESQLARTFGPSCVCVQVENRCRRDRILRTQSRLVLGSRARYEAAKARLEDGQRPNTSYAERLNLSVRRSLSYLHRRTSAPVREPQCLAEAVDLLRCYYNFVRPHSGLRFGWRCRTPAMQAGIFERPLTLREILSWVPPPLMAPYTIDFRTRPATVRSAP